MKNQTIAIIALISISLGSVTGIAYGALTTSIDNSGRREYGYCPISPETMLSRAQFEINGCPLVRVYITNWEKLSTSEQQTIDNQMRSLGFRDIGELDARTK